MHRTYGLWIATVLLTGLFGYGCGGGCGGGGGGKGLGKEPIILDGVQGEGVVKRYSGTSKVDETITAENVGCIVFDVQHVDRLINKEVAITLTDADGAAITPEPIPGNHEVEVTFGEDEVEKILDARLVYAHSEIARHESEMKGLVVHQGRKVTYKVKIEAPVGFLDLRFLNDGVDVGPKVTYDLHPAATEEGGERGEAMIEGQVAGESLAVASGRYDVHATYKETEKITQEAWIEGLEVGSAMARLVHEYDFAVMLHGFIMNARNFGEDVNDRSTVYFYTPGANVLFAVAQDQGPCGKRLVVQPGTYDVRVVYQPGPEQNTWGDKVIHNVEIGQEGKETAEAEGEVAEGEVAEGEAAEGEAAEGEVAEGEAAGGEVAEGEVAEGEAAEGEGAEGDAEAGVGSKSQLIEMEIDLEKALGTLQVKALYGGADVSDKAILRAIFAGADKQAASALLNVTGLGTHVIPAGDYDIMISYDEADHRGQLWFEGIHLEHGDTWTQDVELRQ